MKSCFINRVPSLRASLYIQCKFKGSHCIELIWARLSTYNTMYFESELKDRLKFGVCIALLLTSSRFPAKSGPSLYCSIAIDVKMAPYSCSWLLAASISFVLYALNDSGASGLTSRSGSLLSLARKNTSASGLNLGQLAIVTTLFSTAAKRWGVGFGWIS